MRREYHTTLVCTPMDTYGHLTCRASGGSDRRLKCLYTFRAVIALLMFLSPFATEAQVAICTPDVEPLHIVLLGDSNTALGGDRCDQPKGWNKWFADLIKPTSCRSYARSGATWTNTPQTKPNTTENIGRIGNDNVIFNQINRLIEAYEKSLQAYPDVVIIAAGTNDVWFGKSRPEAFGRSVEEAFVADDDTMMSRKASEILSLTESVRYGCLLLREHFSKALIIVMTPLQTTAVKGDGIGQAGDLIEGVATRMGIPVIRQDKVCVVSSKAEAKKRLHTYDGTHTSVLGARKNGEILVDIIRPLIDKHRQR